MRRQVSGAATLILDAPSNNGGKDLQLLLRPGQVITSPESRLQYQVERILGAGGFGQVFLVRRLGRSQEVPQAICIKVSARIDGWLREAYFGQLLKAHPRAIRVYDTFPLVQPDGSVLYCLALEYAINGDLSVYLHRSGKGWAEGTVRREIAGILQVLGKLHRGQMLHRDLTPMNVFVCEARRLKLGDFGIVRHQNDGRGITVNTLNLSMVPTDIRLGEAGKWQSRDDVYQVGQLIGMLVKGDASHRIRSHEVRLLECSDHLKEIIYRCIGERRKRYETADELIEALRNPPVTLRSRTLKTLKGEHVAFTGILTKPRREAILAAQKAGAFVHTMPSIRTTVVVRGVPNPQQAVGRDAGLKLMEIKRLREKGHKITLLNETQFWRLAGKR
ncbi:MAG: protein kinase [Acidobacteriota bacterium]